MSTVSVLTCTIARDCLPDRVFEQSCGIDGAAFGQLPLRLLVFCQPNVVPAKRMDRFGDRHQCEDDDQHPSAPESKGSKGQQQQQQPGPFFLPLVRRERCVRCRGGVDDSRQQSIQVPVVSRQDHVPAVSGGSQASKLF